MSEESLFITLIILLAISLFTNLVFYIISDDTEIISDEILDDVCETYFGEGYRFTPLVQDGTDISCINGTIIKQIIVEDEN